MVFKKFFFFYLVCIGFVTQAQILHPDSTQSALKKLILVKSKLRLDLKNEKNKIAVLQNMLEVGMWEDVVAVLKKNPSLNADYKLLYADYYLLNNDYQSAQKLVNPIYAKEPLKEKAVLLKANLELQAWNLDAAAAICELALKKIASNKIKLLFGRIKLLKKEYPAALQLAKEVEKKDPNNAMAFLLEADVYFWNQQPQKAEAPLLKSLQINPFNADARFSYGYAIWRRVDAKQLNAMAAQWEIALKLNPLHFQTHWHWGNGHTNLTYVDYASSDDENVKMELRKSDSLFQDNKVQEAISFTRIVEHKYPSSVIPLMYRASMYYSGFDLDRKMRLDSAQHIFEEILKHKKHYGPAHNGLSAVIKSKRIPFLSIYDSITQELNNTKIKDLENFSKVFPDVNYYPGDRVKAMAWNQLFTSVVYFPFLTKGGDSFRIPPLHKDLAETMNSSFFRTSTTFDNRQWMDIRGVGSGAAAIEYVERGAYLERNVLLHEYAHLFHGRVLTDAENRAIRKHYYAAMKEGRTLDYYSQNNESEYFAQTYPAYFEPVKVHPLDFKSMNTTSDLKSKDPEMYDFLDKLIKKERAYLNGDSKAMASNWAQVYLNLSSRNRNNSKRYLDTALAYDGKYLPAILSYANVYMNEKNFEEAAKKINLAEEIDSYYAPIYVAKANLSRAKAAAEIISAQTSLQEQTMFLNKAFEIETDYSELASINTLLRNLYKNNAMYAEAIYAADVYVKNGAQVSTYLRDRRDDALSFSAVIKASLGYVEYLNVLKELVEKKPQNYEYRKFYADALSKNLKFKEANETLQEAQRILAASKNSRNDYNLRIAENYLNLNQADSAKYYLGLIKGRMGLNTSDQLKYAQIQSDLQNNEEAESVILSLNSSNWNLLDQSDFRFVKGVIEKNKQNALAAEQNFLAAIKLNPYNISVYKELIQIYSKEQDQGKLKELSDLYESLKLKPVKKLFE